MSKGIFKGSPHGRPLPLPPLHTTPPPSQDSSADAAEWREQFAASIGWTRGLTKGESEAIDKLVQTIDRYTAQKVREAKLEMAGLIFPIKCPESLGAPGQIFFRMGWEAAFEVLRKESDMKIYG